MPRLCETSAGCSFLEKTVSISADLCFGISSIQDAIREKEMADCRSLPDTAELECPVSAGLVKGITHSVELSTKVDRIFAEGEA